MLTSKTPEGKIASKRVREDNLDIKECFKVLSMKTRQKQYWGTFFLDFIVLTLDNYLESSYSFISLA